jgi:hypothetical protein
MMLLVREADCYQSTYLAVEIVCFLATCAEAVCAAASPLKKKMQTQPYQRPSRRVEQWQEGEGKGFVAFERLRPLHEAERPEGKENRKLLMPRIKSGRLSTDSYCEREYS